MLTLEDSKPLIYFQFFNIFQTFSNLIIFFYFLNFFVLSYLKYFLMYIQRLQYIAKYFHPAHLQLKYDELKTSQRHDSIPGTFYTDI